MIRLVTFNIHHGAPAHGRVDIAGAVRVCRELDADVLAIQEVDRGRRRSGFRDQARAVATATGLHLIRAPALRRGFATYGTALLTRHPVRSVEFLALPGAGTERRVAVLAALDVGGTRVSIAALHLHASRTVAPRQLHRVLVELNRRPCPRVLLGDLNLGPDEVEPVLAAARFVPATGPPTFPAQAPVRRIDWIAARGLRLVAAEVPAVTVSDHRPMVVDATIGR